MSIPTSSARFARTLQEELETDIVPKYGDKLRVVFKEFPLVNIHDWALTGAIAAQCTYQIDPSKYVAFRSAVFKKPGEPYRRTCP